MYYVYILFSKSLSRFYIGQTNNVKERLHRHNTRKSGYTRNGRPWELVYKEGNMVVILDACSIFLQFDKVFSSMMFMISIILIMFLCTLR